MPPTIDSLDMLIYKATTAFNFCITGQSFRLNQFPKSELLATVAAGLFYFFYQPDSFPVSENTVSSTVTL